MQRVQVGGFSFWCREGTSDLNTVLSCVVENEYDLPSSLEGRSLFDIGAHIGGVSVLAASRGARVIAVEPVPENATMIRENAALNGVEVEVLCAAVGTTRIRYGWEGDESAEAHAWVANTGLGHEGYVPRHEIEVRAFSLSDLVTLYGSPDILKIDAEGAEWDVLDDPAIHAIPLIVGEWHYFGGDGSREGVTKRLPHHTVTFSGADSGCGGFCARLS